MNFVDEDDRPAAARPAAHLRRRHHLFDLFDSREHGAEGDEPRLGHVRDDARERGLACAGWPPEDDRLKQVAFDCLAQGLPAREDVILPDDLVQRARPNPFGERRTFRPIRR